MSFGDAETRFTVDETTQGATCAQCGMPLRAGDMGVTCNACHGYHHAGCWDTKGGCGTADCENAPLPQLAIEAQPIKVPLGTRSCPFCKETVNEAEQVCPFCDQLITADGKFHGERENAPGAVAAMVWGIVGIFVCQIIFGIVAISKARAAKETIAMNPRYGGEGYATAGYVLGIIDVVLFALGMLIRFAALAS